MNPKVSIIVPVYKVECYLSRCIESVIAQTFENWEMILIDDGSPDNSGLICDKYAFKDERIRVIHKKNGGVSSARNVGIESARGEWIMFIDSDDYIHVNTLEKCVYICENNDLDIVQFNFSRSEKDLGVLSNCSTQIMTNEDYIKIGKVLVCVWGSLIRSQIINQFSIRFDEKMKLGEDQLFIFECLVHANFVSSIPDKLYYYYSNSAGATNTEKVDDLVYSCKRCAEFKKTYSCFESKIDDLGLHFIEKLILRADSSICEYLLTQLNPRCSQHYPICTRIMVKQSKCDVYKAIRFMKLVYPSYRFFMDIMVKLKHFVLPID